MALTFEWSKSKARDNCKKHGVSFDFAKQVFDDPFAVELLDDRESYDEERFVIIGRVGACVFSVVYTERHESLRIISARKATKHEQQAYIEENR